MRECRCAGLIWLSTAVTHCVFASHTPHDDTAIKQGCSELETDQHGFRELLRGSDGNVSGGGCCGHSKDSPHQPHINEQLAATGTYTVYATTHIR
jgi:hypothetical protein